MLPPLQSHLVACVVRLDGDRHLSGDGVCLCRRVDDLHSQRRDLLLKRRSVSCRLGRCVGCRCRERLLGAEFQTAIRQEGDANLSGWVWCFNARSSDEVNRFVALQCDLPPQSEAQTCGRAFMDAFSLNWKASAYVRVAVNACAMEHVTVMVCGFRPMLMACVVVV